MAQIIAELARRGIPAERKSIYLDLEHYGSTAWTSSWSVRAS